jgi:apolipoprotein N-acyltransferase
MPRVFVPSVLSGVLLWAAFFPLNLGPLGFFALVPWLSLVRAAVSRGRRYFAAYVGGVVFFLLATNWVRVAHPMMYASWAGLSLVMPLTWLLALFFIRRLDRLGMPLSLSVPIAWVAIEYARMHFPTGFWFLKPLGIYQMIGFGWYFLGYAQHAFLPFIQIADIGGVYLVSFVVAAVNGAIAEGLSAFAFTRKWLRWPEPVEQPRPRVFVLNALFALSLAIAGTAYGFMRLAHPDFAVGPHVSAIQGSVAQQDKMTDTKGLFNDYNNLCLSVTRESDLVVWPETCYPYSLYTLAPGVNPNTAPEDTDRLITRSPLLIQIFATGLKMSSSEPPPPPWRTNVLLGMNTYEWDGNREVPANTALLVDANGRIVARYDKMHLVPFGEYVPLRTIAPWMQMFSPYKYDYSCRPGESWTRFPLTARDGRTFTFGCLICYEDSDPYLARHYVDSEPVNFLVNISNDGWFDGTEEHEEHLAICRFRAIEARRSVVRAVNMGISGVIDSDGRVVALPGPSWSASKKMEGVVNAAVTIDSRGSLYATLGDWLPALCWLTLVVGLVILKLRKPAHSPA